MQKDHSPPLELPTVETSGHGLPDTPRSPLSPSASRSIPAAAPFATPSGIPPSPGAQINAQPSFRRHHRKRSSTIFVQARPAPLASHVEDTTATSGLVRGVTTFAGAQLLAKLLAFVLNQLLIRFLGARELGAASQLDLLVGTALALSRDALRLSSQRKATVKAANKSEYTTDGRPVLNTIVGASQETVNLGWFAALLGAAVIAAISSGLYLNDSWPAHAIGIAASAAIIELVAEPCFLLIQRRLELAQRAKAESAANTVRVATVAFSLLALHISPFIGFALGHLSYALVLAVAFYAANLGAARADGFSLLPVRLWTDQGQHRAVYISDSVWRTFVELEVQQVVKFFLVEGDKLAVGFMTTLEVQGEYALAGNYGSLLARLVFLPIEEALRGYFTRVFPREQAGSAAAEPKHENIHAPPHVAPPIAPHVAPAVVPPVAQPDSPLATDTLGASPLASPIMETRAGGSIPDEKLLVLTSILRAYTYLGILAAGFGPLIAGYLISFVVSSSKFAGAVPVLAAYACYIPVLAWNGALEALVQSVASLRTLREHGFVLSGIALLFVVLTYVLVSIANAGAAGIVWAQIIAMSLRTAWALRFATAYFERGPAWLQSCLPPYWVGAVSLACVAVARYVGEAHNFKTFCAVCILASPVAVSALAVEYPLIKGLKAKLSGRHAPSVHSQLKLKPE